MQNNWQKKNQLKIRYREGNKTDKKGLILKYNKKLVTT